MNKDFSFYTNRPKTELIHRYERYLKGNDSGYFDTEEILQIADYYYDCNELDMAFQSLDFGEELHPFSQILNVKRAKIYSRMGKTKTAYRILMNLLESSDEETELLKIEVLLKMSKIEEANQIADKLVREESSEVDKLCGDIASVYMNGAFYTDAIIWLKKGIEFNPQNSTLYLDLGFSYEREGQEPKAISCYQKSIDASPYNNPAWFNLGIINFKNTKYSEALEAFEFALAVQEEDTLSMLYKGHSLFQLQSWKEAKEVYVSLYDSWLEPWEINYLVAECLVNMEELNEALGYYFKSEKELPYHYETLIGIAYCYLELEQYSEVLTYTDKALELDNSLSDAWVYRGEAFMELEEYEKALEVFQKAISLEPIQPEVLLSIAAINLEIKEYDVAQKYYELAYNFDDTIENIELLVAVSCFQNKDYKSMFHYLELAENRNLDAMKMFLEFCPEAQSVL